MAEIVIAGGGPVGTMLAVELSCRGVPALLVREQAAQAGERPIALSFGSRLLLERVGAWPGPAAVGPTPIARIHVSQRHGFGRTVIGAIDCGLPALGYVAAYSEILGWLGAAASQPRALEGRVADWSGDPDGITVRIAGPQGETSERARLLVLADGGHGTVAEEQRDYGQSAVVGEVLADQPHRNTAWERFTPQGPIGLLPYADRYALIWSTDAASAQSLLEADDAKFLERLAVAFGARLGRFREAGARAAFPLFLRRGRAAQGSRTLLIGNASQTLHPVIGQGLNLGLRDASELAQLLAATKPGEIGSERFVQTYRARRRLDRGASIGFTDAVVRIFSNSSAPLNVARGAGLALFDVLPPLRRFLARRMIYGTRAWT